MFRAAWLATWAILLAHAALAVPAPARAAEPVSVPGTGASYVVLGKLAEAFNRKVGMHAIEIPVSTGSTAAFRAVRERRAVLGRADRPPREGEMRIGMRYLPFARDAVVFAVGEAVSLSGLSAERVAAALGGRVQRWAELGGPDLPIRVMLRESRKTSWVLLQRAFPPLATVEANDAAKLAANDFEMIELLDKYRSGLGYTTLSSLAGARTGVRVLSVDGVVPSFDAVASGKYPATTEFGLIYRADNLPRPAREFLDFVFSPEGRRIMTEHGVAPLPRG
jgi:phosphate transport system substrate-binding protein